MFYFNVSSALTMAHWQVVQQSSTKLVMKLLDTIFYSSSIPKDFGPGGYVLGHSLSDAV